MTVATFLDLKQIGGLLLIESGFSLWVAWYLRRYPGGSGLDSDFKTCLLFAMAWFQGFNLAGWYPMLSFQSTLMLGYTVGSLGLLIELFKRLPWVKFHFPRGHHGRKFWRFYLYFYIVPLLPLLVITIPAFFYFNPTKRERIYYDY